MTVQIQNENVAIRNVSGWRMWSQRRYQVTILAFLGFFNILVMRVNLSIAVVAMTENKTITNADGTTTYGPEFDWDSKTQGYILSSFFYGYITTQIFGGWLAARIGGKRVFGLGVASTALLTIVTPFLAKIDLYLLIAVRIVEGIFEGVTFPSIHAVWARWAPPLERSRMGSFAYSGGYIGTLVAMPVTAYLAEAFGWESIFYVTGTVAFLWFLCWWFMVAETPNEDTRISKEELAYIRESLGDRDLKDVKHPWMSIVTSIPVWAIVFAHVSEAWGFYTLLTQLPTFMKDVLHFELGKTGIMSALPYLALSIILQIAGFLGDWLMQRKLLSTTQVRKLFTCFAFGSQTIFMIAAAYVSHPVWSILYLTLALGLGGACWAGLGVNHLDIAPQHASVLMGISNTFATVSGIVTPIVTGYIVQTASESEWQIVFYIVGFIYFCGLIIYWAFASGEVQSWAQVPSTEEEKKGKDNLAYIE